MLFGPTDFWVNFAVVVLVEVAVFVAFAAIRRMPPRDSIGLLASCCCAGVFVGACFDLMVGSRYGVFSYFHRIDPIFLMLNGAFSYGPALATARIFPVTRRRMSPSPVWAVVAAASVFLVADQAATRMLGSAEGLILVAKTVLIGGALIVGGELALVAVGVVGPVLSLVRGPRAAFFRLWICSMVVGFCYEAANLFFPVWRWDALGTYSMVVREIVMVVFGYFALFHPLAAITWAGASIRRSSKAPAASE